MSDWVQVGGPKPLTPGQGWGTPPQDFLGCPICQCDDHSRRLHRQRVSARAWGRNDVVLWFLQKSSPKGRATWHCTNCPSEPTRKDGVLPRGLMQSARAHPAESCSPWGKLPCANSENTQRARLAPHKPEKMSHLQSLLAGALFIE